MICVGTSGSAGRNSRHRSDDDNGKPSTSSSSPVAETDPAGKPAVASRSMALMPATGGRILAVLSLCALRGVLLLLNGFLLLLLLPFRRRTVHVPASASTAIEGEESGGQRNGAVAVGRRGPDLEEAVARRMLAMKMVREAAAAATSEDEGRRSAREFATFRTARGDTLFTQSWASLSVSSRGLVVLLHGLNEHSGRYNHFAKQLNDSGFKVYAMDWIGHGGSDALHGYVHSLDHAVDDLKGFLEKVIEENPGLPCYIFGHSTGAAIILKAALDPKIKVLIEGVVLTSPAIRVQPSHPLVAVFAPILSLLLPRYQFKASYKSGPPVSRDPEALRAKYSDPLVFTGSIRIRTGYEILRISSYLHQNLSRVSVPFLALHGTADTVTDPEATKRLYEEASSSDKSIKLYKDFLHDLLFEPEKDDIIKDILDWLSSRVRF